MSNSNTESYVDRLFRFAVQHREHIIIFFKLLYSVELAILTTSVYLGLTNNPSFMYVVSIGRRAGDMALLAYIATVIPGIGRRFHYRHKLISLLMIFRRYTGIAMFFFAFIHGVVERGIGYLNFGLPNVLPPLFELFGIGAFSLLIPLVITSNDRSVQYLKKTWDRIHRLTYVIIWFAAFHIILQGVSFWALLIGVTLTLQVASWINKFRTEKMRRN